MVLSRATDKHRVTLSLCGGLDSATENLQSPSCSTKGHSASLTLYVKGEAATIELQGAGAGFELPQCDTAALYLKQGCDSRVF